MGAELFHVKQAGRAAAIVSRETGRGFLNQIETMFHVKQTGHALLADTEFAEDHVQDILDIDPAEQTSE